MILQKEILTIAEQKGVVKTTIDKDWVLGHFLAAIYSQQALRENLIFKGGTCLKKCWFPDYRFSEDLDFTSCKTDFELKKKLSGFYLLACKGKCGDPDPYRITCSTKVQRSAYWIRSCN